MPQLYFNIDYFKGKDVLSDYYNVIDTLITKNKNFIRYIKNPYKLNEVSGFFDALKDNFEGWYLHHIAGEYLDRKILIERNLYYDQEPWMLKFIKETEHLVLHSKVHNNLI